MKHSLRSKTVLLIVMIALTFSTVSMVASGQIIQRLIDLSYQGRAMDVSKTMAAILDAEQAETLKNAVMEIYHATDEKVMSDAWGTPEFDAYCARYSHLEQSAEFVALRQTLRRVQDSNDVDCVYLVTIDIPTESFIYLVDAAYEDACPPGCVDPLYEENRELLKNPSIGFQPYITNTEPYGWLVTAGVPVYTAEGRIACYALTDISMEQIRAQQSRFTLICSLVLAALTALISLIAIWVVNREILKPINLLSNAAANYSARPEDSNELDNLPIKSRDEIQLLYSSLLKMAHNTRSYIESLKETRQVLTETRREADEMNELALRDPLTGVGSKLAYDRQVMKLTDEVRRGEAHFGIVMIDMNGLKDMNDRYGHERGDQCIKILCGIICNVFRHSPVFRFGGDEFAVILERHDLEHADELVKAFNEEIALRSNNVSLPPWERISAAIGCAFYQPGRDRDVDAVFKRADQAMYEKKRAMKGGRQAPTTRGGRHDGRQQHEV